MRAPAGETPDQRAVRLAYECCAELDLNPPKTLGTAKKMLKALQGGFMALNRQRVKIEQRKQTDKEREKTEKRLLKIKEQQLSTLKWELDASLAEFNCAKSIAKDMKENHPEMCVREYFRHLPTGQIVDCGDGPPGYLPSRYDEYMDHVSKLEFEYKRNLEDFNALQSDIERVKEKYKIKNTEEGKREHNEEMVKKAKTQKRKTEKQTTGETDEIQIPTAK